MNRSTNDPNERVIQTLRDYLGNALNPAFSDTDVFVRLVLQSPLSVLFIGKQGQVVFCNASAAHLLGMPTEALLQLKWTDLEQSAKAAERCSLAAGKQLTEDSLLKTGTEIRPAEIHFTCVTNDPYLLVASVRDSGSPLSAQQLALNLEHFSQMADAFNDIMFTTDLQFRHTELFGRWVEKSGLHPSVFLGKTPKEILGESAGALHEQMMAHALTQDNVLYEWQAGGRYLQTRLSQIVDKNGQITGLLGVGRDVTAQKQYEQKLIRERDKLALLAQAGPTLAQLTTRTEVFAYLVKVLHEVTRQQGAVLALACSESKSLFQLMEVTGSAHVLEALQPHLEPRNISGELGCSMIELIKLEAILDRTHFESVPDEPLTTYLKNLSSTLPGFGVHGAGIVHSGHLLGLVVLLLPQESGDFDAELISAFASHISSILEKNLALENLTVSDALLQKSEAKYRRLVDTAPVVLYEFHPEQGGLFYSDQVKTVLGYSAEELRHAPHLWPESIHPDDLVVVQTAMDSFFRGERFDIMYRLKHRKGQQLWLRDISINHGQGESVIRGLVMDVTREKEQELQITEQMRQLHDKELQLRLAIESAQEGIFDWDIPSDEVKASDILTEILESPLPDSQTMTNIVERFVYNKSHPAFFENMERLRSGQLAHMQQTFRVITSGKQIKWLKITGRVVEWTSTGRGKRFIGTCLDVTQSKQAEIALQEYNQRLQVIIENTPAIVFNGYPNSKLEMIFMSDYSTQILGYTPAEMTSQTSLAELIHEDDQSQIRRKLREAYEQQSKFNLTYRVTNRNGETRWVNEMGEFRTYKEPMEQNVIEGIIVDITDRVKAEERTLAAVIDAQDHERNRIAKEIHDNVQQSLVSAFMTLSSMRSDVVFASSAHQARFEAAMNNLNKGIADTRAIARALIPRQVSDFGFVDSVQNLLDTLDENIRFDFYCNFEDRLDPKIELNLFRITQEAINNIVRHAQCTEVFIQVTRHDDLLTLTIEDNGRGFEAESLTPSDYGYGLFAMKSRAAAIGAHFEISSHPGQGTFVIVELSLK